MNQIGSSKNHFFHFSLLKVAFITVNDDSESFTDELSKL